MSTVFNNTKKLNTLRKRLDTLPWSRIGRIALRSVHRNFDVGGRPKWKKRKINKPWSILKRSGRLRNGNLVELIPGGVSVVNRVPYQAVHNFGYGVRNIPQRKYLKLRLVDFKKMRVVLRRHLSV